MIYLYYIVVPYRVSFKDFDDINWIIIDTIFDLFFLTDIILNFLTAFIDEDGKLVYKY